MRTETGKLLPLGTQNLTRMDPGQLDGRIAADARALRAITAGLLELEQKGWYLKAALDVRPGKFTQAENDQVRQLLLSYINYRTALFRMAAFHSSYATAHDPRRRQASFMVYYTAGITLFARGLALSVMMEDSPNASRKLNEPEPIWGIPPDLLDTVYDNVTHEGNVQLLSRTRAQYQAMQPELREAGLLDDPLFAWMPDYLTREETDITRRLERYGNADWVRFARETKQVTSSIWYAIQAFMANLAGDTRVWPAKAAISDATVRDIADELEPGDIILARKNFYISNGFLPGFWPHAILYVGTADELEARGLTDRPWVARHLDRYRQPARDGNPHRVIEAISEGVVFSSLEQVMHADFVAVLRPRLSPARKDAAIERAFAHLGKPYDFDFDFFSTDALVCTELVYRAYDEDIGGERLDLRMQRILGRDTYPAIEFVRKYTDEWDADEARAPGQDPRRQLDFVVYLDGDERRDRDDFADTADRPSTPERRGFTVGLSGGYHFSGEGGVPLDSTRHGGVFTLRAGHSLTWSLLLQYELWSGWHAIDDVTRWRLGHLTSVQWHPTRVWFLSAGLGVEHGLEAADPRALGPLGAFAVGYEFLQGYSWALDARLYYHLSLDDALGAPRSAAGITAGIQFY